MIGIDWGTTRLRAYRLAADGAVLARRDTPRGVLGIEPGGFPDTLRGAIGDWIAEGESQVLICGMAGSQIGWIDTPYLPCPADLEALAEAAVVVPFDGADVRIVPGLSCRDRHGVPEVMRGEETQMLGAALGDDATTICLPGSHTKWASMAGGAVTGFTTHLSGEAFAALSGHTILGRMMDTGAPHHPRGFARGVARARQGGGLLHHLFGVRASSIFNEINEAEAASFLSGLLIGHEVAAALEEGVAPPVILIGADMLTARYGAALDIFGIPHRSAAPDAAAQGLYRIAQRLGMNAAR
jgi:2-dehydro-3-deoxygalactonokinase